MTLKYLIQKEFIQIRRNSFLPKLIVVFPIMIYPDTPQFVSAQTHRRIPHHDYVCDAMGDADGGEEHCGRCGGY